MDVKFILAGIIILFVVLVSGCTAPAETSGVNGDNGDATPPPEPPPEDPPVEDETPDPPPEDPPEEPEIPTIEETITLCDAACNSDSSTYCVEERSIEIDGNEVSGTCRAFARKGLVDGFNRCQGFCKGVAGASTTCKVDGFPDANCDGVI